MVMKPDTRVEAAAAAVTVRWLLEAGKTSTVTMEINCLCHYGGKLSLKVVARGRVSPPPLVEVNQASISLVV